MSNTKIRLFTPDEDAKAAEASRLRGAGPDDGGMSFTGIAAELGYDDGYAAQRAVLQYAAEHGLMGPEHAAGLRDAPAIRFFERCLEAVAARDARSPRRVRRSA